MKANPLQNGQVVETIKSLTDHSDAIKLSVSVPKYKAGYEAGQHALMKAMAELLEETGILIY